MRGGVLDLGAGALAAFGRQFPLPLHARRLEVLPAAEFGQNSVLLHLLTEPLQHALEGFAFAEVHL